MKINYYIVFIVINLISFQNAFSQNVFEMMNDESSNFYEVQKEAKKYFDSVGTGKGTGYKVYKRWEYDASLQIDNNGYRKTTAEIGQEYQRAIAHFRKSNARLSAVTNWTELGPDKITPTSSWSAGVGRVEAIAVSLKTPSLIFVGAEAGGVWKSTDGGNSWTPTMHSQTNQKIRSIAIDPQNDNIIYAGTTSGYYKSTDGGNSWTLSSSVPNSIYKIIIHPSNSNIIYTAGSSGIYKTTNAGSSWTKTNSTSVEDIEFKPKNPNTLYAVGGGSGAVIKSTDGGNTFSSMGLFTSSNRRMIAVTPADTNFVYILESSGELFGAFYKSTNSGNTFSTMSTGSSGNNNIFGNLPDGTGTTGQAFHDMALDISPTNAILVQVGAILSFSSSNGGSTWTATTDWIWGNKIGYNHADLHVMTYFGNVLYSGSDGGIYKSTNDGGDWTDLSTGLGIRQFYRLGLCKANPEIISGGAQDNGTSVRRSDGKWYDWLGADGMETFVDHSNSSILYGTSQLGGLYKSTNGGNTRTSITKPTSENGNWITPFRMDPQTSTTLYVGYANVYKSINSGSTWTTLSTYSSTSNCDEIEIAPSNSNFIITRHSQNIFKTSNGGTSWTNITKPSGAFFVNTIAIHPTNPSIVLLGTSAGQVYISSDFGANFTQVIGGSLPAIPILKIVFDEGTNDGYYIGNSRGVFYRDKTMNDFLPFTENLPTQSVYDMEYHVATKRIYVATYGRGVWWAPAYNSGPINKNPTIIISSPSNNTTFTDPSSITIKAIAADSDGTVKKVQFFTNGILIGTDSIAPYSINWSSNLQIGTYFLTAVVFDDLNAKTTSSAITIKIKSSINQLPLISITSPSVNQLYDQPNSVNCTVNASDIDGSITNVKYYLNGTLSNTSDFPYNFTFPNLYPGKYTLKAVATDDLGATATDSVTFIVRIAMKGSCTIPAWKSDLQYCGGQQVSYNNELWEAKWCASGEIPGSNQWGTWMKIGTCISISYNQIPNINISTPVNKASFTAPASFSITATATDADGSISKVEFYSNNIKLGEAATNPYTFDAQNLQVGTYDLIAIATDNQGSTDTSSIVSIDVILLTSVNEALSGNEVFVYPNPVSDILYLRSPELIDKTYSITITNQTGITVFNQNINLLNTYGLNIKNFSNGIYFIKIENGVNKKVVKFEIKK